MPNSIGKTNKDVRRFIRENGGKPTAGEVEKIAREIRRTQAENEAVEKRAREREREKGAPSTTDEKGDVHARVRKIVQRDIEKRAR